jgi:hypothetical protein
MSAMPFFYQSGEEIRTGDHVSLHGEPGQIELVADPATEPDSWFVKEHGTRVAIVEPKVFGRLFLRAPISDCSDHDELNFVSRRP